jgi:hypothetical protein
MDLRIAACVKTKRRDEQTKKEEEKQQRNDLHTCVKASLSSNSNPIGVAVTFCTDTRASDATQEQEEGRVSKQKNRTNKRNEERKSRRRVGTTSVGAY